MRILDATLVDNVRKQPDGTFIGDPTTTLPFTEREPNHVYIDTLHIVVTLAFDAHDAHVWPLWTCAVRNPRGEQCGHSMTRMDGAPGIAAHQQMSTAVMVALEERGTYTVEMVFIDRGVPDGDILARHTLTFQVV